MIDASLPDLETLDSEALKKIIAAQHRQLLEQQQRASRQIESASRKMEQAGQQIEHLKLVIEKYRQMLFGAKSEKLRGDLEQL